MKNKPVRHKETNTFKFKKFSERISEIDVDVFHRVAHRNEEFSDDEESLETNFHKTLQKWNVLNLTEGYKSFRKEVQHVVTLPQLLKHKQEVLDSLTKYLRMKNATFVQPILELVVAAAKDLQKDFYEHFPHFLSLIIDLLSTKDPEILEYSFTTLAYLFKFLWRYLIKNIDRAFELLLPLLVDTKPEYVNNFAAESFAFVARKVRDREAFLKLVFEALEKTPDGTVGCGKLLFEVVSGISGQFHSCAEQMLTLYLNALIDDSMDEKLVFDVLQQVFTCITNSIIPKNSQILWTVIFKFLDEHSTAQENKNKKMMTLVLRLSRLIVDHRGGRMLINPVEMKSKIVKIIPVYDDEVLKEAVDLSIDILLANNLKLTQEVSSEFVSKLLSIKNREILSYIVEKLVDHSSFETLILPMALQRSVLKEEFGNNELDLFSKIVNGRAPPSLGGINSKSWRKMNLDLRGFPATTIDYLHDKLENWEEENVVSEESLRVVVVLPHVSPVNNLLLEKLKKNLITMHTKLIGDDYNDASTTEIEKRSFAFLLTLESTIHLLEIEDFQKFINDSKMDILELIKKYSNVSSILNTADIFLTFIKNSEERNLYINEKIFDEINEHLGRQLGSPYGKIRLTVSHIYSLFSEVEELFIEKNDESLNALSLLFAAESVETTVYNYRDRLIHLQALTFTSRALTNLKPKYHDFPVRFLIGNLYINFSLLWDPTAKAIATFASEKCPQFWPIFLEELRTQSLPPTPDLTKNLFNSEVLKTLTQKLSSTDKPDHQNYKILLWKCMSEFPEYVEVKNRDVTVLFIEFVENKIFKSNSETARSYNILKRDSSQEATLIDENDSEDEEKPTKEGPPRLDSPKKSGLKKLGRSSDFKLLLSQLSLFSKAHNPRMMYRESEMYQIYLDLLTSKSVELQKAVLDCLSSYKHKSLMPYKDHLYGLIEEKNLRNELARFKVEHEEETTGMIQEDHRESLMPILMRLIYAKMISKGTGRAAGAAGGLVRRKIILRFLMGVKETEMMLFTKMAFKPFEKYQITLSPEANLKDLKTLTTDVIKNLDLSDVIPPKRLRSAVNLLSIIIEEFGAKMSRNLLPRLLALLLCIMAHIKGILEQHESVLSGFIPMIKDLKNTCIGIVARFFGHFEDYNWSETELDVLFDVAVFPWIEKLPVEGVHSPTSLLKLLSSWCQNPRYFCLLVKHEEGNSGLSPLPFVIKLLLGNKTHPSVVNTILDMLEKLLTLQDYGVTPEDQMEVDDVKIPLNPRNLLEVNAEALLPGVHINYGSSILLPHVPDVLSYIKRKFQKSKYGVNRTETSILARISELNLDPETSNSLVSLSLPILVKRAMKGEAEEAILELLTTISNLMRNVQEPHVHLRAILPLFSCVGSSAARKLLLQLFKTIASKDCDSSPVPRDIMVKTADLLVELNAVDQRWIDQPDFERRLNAFSEIKSAITSGDEEQSKVLTIEFGVAVLYCCFYFLKRETDLSLRDSAGQCLNILGPELAKRNKENKVDRMFLIEETILKLVRTGIRSKNEAVCLRSISFLGAMSMECPDVHPVLRDLNLLTDRVDPEVDFFENLQHLQLHRKARAFLKFCTMSKSLEKAPNSKTLTQFIFPLASSYLCNASFANKNSLVDSAIETVGAVCRLLPWHQYAIILKYYLDKLRSSTEFQRQIVRTVITILDAFHYDLSKLKSVEDVTKPEDKSEQVQAESAESEEDKTEASTPQIEEEPDEALDEALSKEEDSPEDQKIPEDEEQTEVKKFVEKQIVLSPYAAKGLVFDITNTLLPQLHRSILSRTQHEMSHKVNRKRTGAEKEEEELMRVPIALALVKLLQKLPERILDKNLPGIFMKLCTFLKSRLESVRRSTREILQKIMITLGPDYLHHLLREMNSLLTRGFQIHVLAYTIHAVLLSLKPLFKESHVNENLQSILQVCKVDLFGISAEEKEIAAVTKNTSEAKSTKSFDIFHVLGQFITESCLIDLLQPLVAVLNDSRSHKTVRKVVECLRHVVLGLADNVFIQPDKLLIFLYGVVSKSIPALSASRPRSIEGEKPNNKTQISDCFIIPAEPKSRMGLKAAAKTSGDTNDHILLEFALKLLHVLLKREKVTGGTFKHFLDPFVPILSDCLSSQQVKMSTLSLQCLNWIIKMDLDSVRSSITEICASIFKILHKYGAAGLSKGDNFDLVMAAFKTMSVLVRDVKHFDMSDDQVKALILYAEQDLHNYERQATAFNLLKAIINRKLIIPEMHEVMKRVAALSVTSESENVRQQARNVFYAFLMEYPLGKDLEKHLSFYLSQLSYEVQMGRLSALNMVLSIVTGFPEAILTQQSALIFIMVGARLANDEDPECKKLSAKCVKEIVTRVPHNQRVKLFDIVIAWFKNPKVSLRGLAAQLCGIFVTVERDSFETRLGEVLPLVLKQFRLDDNEENEPGKFVKRKRRKIVEEDVKDPERLKDHHLFQVLQLTLKISANCSGFLKSEKYVEEVLSLGEYSQANLGHPHLWVRLAATQQIGFILATLDGDKLSHYLQFKRFEDAGDSVKGYVYSSPVETLRSLSLDLIAQLQPGMEFEELADQVVKNLVFIARVVKTASWGAEGSGREDGVSLLWLVKRVRKCVNMEVTQNPKSTCVRSAAFKWTAGVVTTIPIEPYLKPILFQLMSPLVREMMTTEESNAPLRQLSKEVGRMIKKRIDDDEYAKLLARVQQKLDVKRAERKKTLTQQYVIDPELAAKKKIAKQLKKKEAKKRKRTEIQGKRRRDKRPRKENNVEIM
ncbi:small subunit processome component 20 homolog [Diachasma alloeum]|uniref:small subunit processome component 20 homolog n=1 Tax=Diachasma alloeum TaxID=454923 RepID=UPI0007384E11|nr:small subunit processome component 20 homolog [Diachasma alloeum]